jgi:TetR/AcrR family transcriptional regulator
VFAWIGEALGAAFETAVAEPGSPLARLERAFVAHIAFVAANPGVPRVLYHELQYPVDSPVRAAVRTMIDGYRRRVESLLRSAVTAGELARGLDVGLAAMLFVGAVQALVVEASLAGEAATMNRRARPAFRLLLFGLRGAPRTSQVRKR